MKTQKNDRFQDIESALNDDLLARRQQEGQERRFWLEKALRYLAGVGAIASISLVAGVLIGSTAPFWANVAMCIFGLSGIAYSFALSMKGARAAQVGLLGPYVVAFRILGFACLAVAMLLNGGVFHLVDSALRTLLPS